MGYVKCANCGKENYVVTGVSVEKCEYCKKSLYVCEKKPTTPDWKSCKHIWIIQERSSSGTPILRVCQKCHAICRVINNVNHFCDADGNPFTYIPDAGEGEKELEFVEKEIQNWKDGKCDN